MMGPPRGVRVLFWSELFRPYIGGNETMAAELLPTLRAKGHEFVVVTSHDWLSLPDRDDHRGIPVHRFPFRPAVASRSTGAIAGLRREVAAFVEQMAPDLIHLSPVGPSAYFLPLSSPATRAVPLLVHLHGELLASQASGQGSMLRRVLHQAAWVVSVSAAVLAQVTEAFPSVRRRSSVIPNAVREPVEAPAELSFEPPRILCLGRLVPEKGFDVALRVLANVRRRVPGVRLVVAGDGGERPRLEREACELGLGEGVRFVGAVAPEDVPAVINRATLVLMPSRREGLPLVAIEAALMGRPVVATAVSGLAEVVADGETGRLAAKDDVEGLSRAVLDLLAHPERTRRMGRSARERARDRFGLARCTASFDALYTRLVPSSPEAAAATAPR